MIMDSSNKITFWTKAHTERLQKLFVQYGSRQGWAIKISKQFKHAVTPSAVYHKAARIGLAKPSWVLKENYQRKNNKKT